MLELRHFCFLFLFCFVLFFVFCFVLFCFFARWLDKAGKAGLPKSNRNRVQVHLAWETFSLKRETKIKSSHDVVLKHEMRRNSAVLRCGVLDF